MIKALIGYTGFVGSNLMKQTKFDFTYNTSNIDNIDGKEFDLLVIAAPSAVKWKANQEPEKDLEMINGLIDHLKQVKAKQVVQISTVDIYKNPSNVNENTLVDTDGLHPYGKNRFYLEEFIRRQFNKHLIARLPALFGEGLKKNFIYDLISIIPSVLPENTFLELSLKNNLISQFYTKQENGTYKCVDLSDFNKNNLKNIFKDIGFNAINFTDSRSIFQFYNLAHLWKHIQIALENKINTINLSTEPISTNEIFYTINNSNFNNHLDQNPVSYNIRTKYSKLFNGKDGYIFDKEHVLTEIRNFVSNQKL